MPAWYDLPRKLQDVLAVATASESGASSSDLAGTIGISRRSAHRAADDLVTLGYLSRTRSDSCVSTRLVSAAVIERAWAGLGDDPRNDLPAAATAARCGKWMPRAHARCRLNVGHAGRCRSRLPRYRPL